MKLRSTFKVFALFLYLPWLFDMAIAVVSFVFVLMIVIVSISNPQLANLGNIIFGLIALLYSVANSMVKKNNDTKELDILGEKLANIFESCRKIVLANYPESEKLTYSVERKVLKTYLDEWKKHKDIKPFEYQLIDSYLNHIVAGNLLDECDKLFLKYRIVTSDMTSHFPALVSEIEKGDYFTSGTAHNNFIKKVYWFANSLAISGTVNDFDLNAEKIQDTLSYALKKSNPVMESLIRERKSREKIQYLLNKCYENAYSNIGNLDKELSDDTKRNLILLYKYDERYGVLKLKWRTEIRNHLSISLAKQDDVATQYEIEKKKLDDIIMPQPFSKAIKDFDYCIERIAPRDYFLYVVYPERFDIEAKNWTVEKFMNEKVIPRAKQYLDEFNKELVKEYPFLKKLQKKTIDANYYVFHFTRQQFEYHADQDSIPNAIKRFIVKSILESENATDHLASQLVYVKQVIDNITISGLLFTEILDVQKSVQQKENEILKRARKNNLVINNVHEIVSLGNQFDIFVKIFFEVYFSVTLKRRYGKKYEFAKKTAKRIIENAKDLLQLFDSLKTSSAP